MYYSIEIVIRLLLAGFLGGVIGFEREHTNRPAGFRTHILVCIGSALVMVTSDFVFKKYAGITNLDPARLGAQVISGIGFLGAGTIIRDGFNVRGLTTAASLWAVSCVGIAAGIGFYEGAIMATLLIYITLIVLKKIEFNFPTSNRYKTFIVESDNLPGQIELINKIMDECSADIKNTKLDNESDHKLIVKTLVKMPTKSAYTQLLSGLQGLSGVKKVYEE